MASAQQEKKQRVEQEKVSTAQDLKTGLMGKRSDHSVKRGWFNVVIFIL